MTAVLGPTGSGKTLLGLHFLKQGGLCGEPGVHFGFYETPQFIEEKSKRVGLDLSQGSGPGSVEFVWQSPVENVVDILADRLLAAVRRSRAKRLVIDGLQGFQLAAESQDRTRRVFAWLREEFDALGVTTLYTSEVSSLLGWDVELSVTGVSAVTDNLILLRHVEVGSQLARLLLIGKMRDSGHDESVRSFQITEHGIRVGDVFVPPPAPSRSRADPRVSGSPSKRLSARATGRAANKRKRRKTHSTKRKA
jgi:circadian clock protein KaiC